MGMSAICHRLYVRHLYLASFLFWWGAYSADMLHGIIHSYCIRKLMLKTKRNLKINSNSKSYLENPSNLNPLCFLHPVSKFWVFSLPRKHMEFPMTSILRAPSNLAPIKLKFWSRQMAWFCSNQDFQQPPTTFKGHNSSTAYRIEVCK
jgi:hypothetical protein